MRTRFNFLMLALFGTFSLSASAQALNYPSQPIKIIIPYQAGGGTDQILRVITPRVSELLKTQIVVVNQPGANTVLGMKAAMDSKPDGYTLVLSTNTSFSLIPYTMQPQPYDPKKSFSIITAVGETPMILTTHPGFSQNIQEFTKKVKAAPGKYSYATYGVGGITHLAAEVLMGEMDIKMNQIPYKGVEAVTNLAGGQVDSMVDGINSPSALIASGKIVPLAILQHTRSKFLPNTPTLTEIGYPKASTSTISYILAAPKGTPPQAIDTIYKAFATALADKSVIEKIEQTKSQALHMTPQESEAYLDNEANRFQKIIKERGLKFN